jgi:PKHD-type hydroxylase
MSNYIFAPSPNFGVSEHPFVTWEKSFDENELNQILKCCDSLVLANGVVGGVDKENGYDTGVRESKIAWVGLNDDSRFIYDRLAFILRNLNGQFYNFDIYGFSEDMQYTVYDGNSNGHYTWHLDNGVSDKGASPRKLSLVLQLSDPSDYEGGDLEVMTSCNPQQIKKEKGMVAVFPSYTLHRVTPVTKGTRKTLVVWAAGPSFK